MAKFKNTLLLIIITAVVSGGFVYILKPPKTAIQTYPWDLKDGTQFSCSTRLGATIFPRMNYETHTFETVDGNLLTNDKTQMAIEIAGKTLKMLTTTSVSIGNTDPAELVIVKDSDTELIAIDPEIDIAINSGTGTFVLNKKSGTAVWTKSKPSFLTLQVPDVQAYFMECR